MQELNKIYCGDCLDVMKDIDSDSVDCIVTDPPYGISFMGKDWDKAVPSVAIWQECLRVLKPGAFAFVMCIPRQDCLAHMICRLEDAGFNVSFSSIYWTYACLSEDTEVLTQYGWMKWERLRKNIYMYKILIYNYEEDKYYFEKPKKWNAYRIRDTCIRIKSNLTDQCITRNHRVFIERKGKLLCIPAERLSFKEIIPVVEGLFHMSKNGFPWSGIQRGFSNSLLNGLWKKGYFKSKSWKETNTCKENRNTMLYLWKTSITSQKGINLFKTSLLFSQVLCNLAFKKRRNTQTSQKDRGVRSSKLDGRVKGIISKKDEWCKQSGMERGSNIFQKTWQLCKRKVCAFSKRVFEHGSQRWICNGTSLISSTTFKKAVMAIRNGTSYRSRSDKQQSGQFDVIPRQSRPQTTRRGKSYKTTLATITKEEYKGIVYCPTVLTGCFVARRKGKIFITGNSGFPKGQNLSKAADKRAGVKQEIINEFKTPFKTDLANTQIKMKYGAERSQTKEGYRLQTIAAPATPQAKALEGGYSGMQLKPAVEIVIVAMKPIEEKTYLDQALSNGHGCTWLDDCQIPYDGDRDIAKRHKDNSFKLKSKDERKHTQMEGWGSNKENREIACYNNKGRFPANVLCEDDVLDDGIEREAGSYPANSRAETNNIYGKYKDRLNCVARNTQDFGSFSRYFSLDAWFAECIKLLPKEAQKTFPFMIIPKASKSEKNRGLEEVKGNGKIIEKGGSTSKAWQCLDCGQKYMASLEACPKCNSIKRERYDVGSIAVKNNHPTCKPIKLMSWLITLASREGDIILDSFCGSGTTAIAAKMLGRQYIGIECEEDYCEIARKRIAAKPTNLSSF